MTYGRCKRWKVPITREEAQDIGDMALSLTLAKYEPQKGSFLGFLWNEVRWLVRERVKEYRRRELERLSTAEEMECFTRQILDRDMLEKILGSINGRVNNRVSEVIPYLLAGFSPREIGKWLGLTENRVCQIRKKLNQIRKEIT